MVQVQECNIDNMRQKTAMELASKWLFRGNIWGGFEYSNKAWDVCATSTSPSNKLI